MDFVNSHGRFHMADSKISLISIFRGPRGTSSAIVFERVSLKIGRHVSKGRSSVWLQVLKRARLGESTNL